VGGLGGEEGGRGVYVMCDGLEKNEKEIGKEKRKRSEKWKYFKKTQKSISSLGHFFSSDQQHPLPPLTHEILAGLLTQIEEHERII